MKRATLLRVATAGLRLGILWNLACWALELLELLRHLHTRDVLGDSIPIALLGGPGFSVGFLTSLALETYAKRRSSHRRLPRGETLTAHE